MRWFRSRFIRSVVAVGGGSAAGQIILVLASPIITRLYGPEVFGIWGIFNAASSIIAPVAALTYTTAIVLPKSAGEAAALARISLWLTLISSVFALSLYLIFGQYISSALKLGTDGVVMLLIGVYVFAVGIGAIAQQWLIRTRRFKRLALSNIAFAGFTAFAQVLGGLLHPSALMLVGGNTVGRAVHSGLMVWFAGGTRSENISDRVSNREAARRYRRFPLLRAPQVLVDGISQALPVVLLGALFGPTAAGFYTLCRSVFGLPAQVVGSAVADVFYSRIVDAFHGGQEVSSLVVRATALLLVTLSVPFLIVMAFGPGLFGFAFGDEWTEAGQYAQWLSLWTWLMISNRAALQAIHVLALQRFHLVLTVIGTVLRQGILLGAAALDFSALESIAAFGFAGAVLNATLIGLVILFCRRHDNQLNHDAR